MRELIQGMQLPSAIQKGAEKALVGIEKAIEKGGAANATDKMFYVTLAKPQWDDIVQEFRTCAFVKTFPHSAILR